MKKWIAIALVILVLAVVAPYGVGVVTEQQWQSATQQLNAKSPFMQVQTSQYDRRYFSGQVAATVRILDPETGETHQVAFNGEISHGVTGSELEFTPSLPDNKAMKELFPDEQPRLTLTTHLWGTVDIDLEVPAINVDQDPSGDQIKMAALSASAEIADQGNAIEFNLDWPGVTIDSDDVQLALKNVTITQDVERVAGRIWQGSMTVGIDSLQADARGKPALQLKSLKIESDTEAEDQRLSSKIIAMADSIVVDGQSTGPHHIEVGLDNVSVPAWNDFLDVAAEGRMARATMSPNATPQQIMQQQMDIVRRTGTAARDLAASGLSFGMPVIELEMPEGVVTGQWTVSHPEVSEDERADMQLLLQQAEAHLSLTVPRAVVKNYPAVAQNLQGLIQQGFVTRDDDEYHVKATLDDMMIDVNGNKIPMPPLI